VSKPKPGTEDNAPQAGRQAAAHVIPAMQEEAAALIAGLVFAGE
jgi:hypothetical protein